MAILMNNGQPASGKRQDSSTGCIPGSCAVPNGPAHSWFSQGGCVLSQQAVGVPQVSLYCDAPDNLHLQPR